MFILYYLSSFFIIFGFFWIIPAIVIAFISFKRDYNEAKLRHLPLKLFFKKISFYSFFLYLIVVPTLLLAMVYIYIQYVNI